MTQLRAQLTQELNKQQIEAVETTEGPLLIIAGAGSGKTRTIIYRIGYMLEQGIPQSSILALTFTNKAAREMAFRVHGLTGKKLSNLTVSTFHAFGVKILRKTIHHLGYNDKFSIYDQADKAALIKEVARELAIAQEKIDVNGISSLFSAVKTGRHAWNSKSEYYKDLYEEYTSHLKAYNAVDFDDLIVLPIEIFTRFPEVLDTYRQKYRYILVDEFQDTSFIQYRLLKLLGQEHRNVCVVGDDDQSIYSWRGANYENLVHFERDFPGVREIKLEQNYRSTKTILTAANGLIANNTNRKEKELWTGIDSGKSIELSYPENEQKEAQEVAEQIKTLVLREKYKYHDFGVLVRTNSLTRSVEEAFLQENIPYRVSGGTSFFQRKEVKDIIGYLRVLANPDDDVNMLRIINTPRRGLGKKTLLLVRETAEKHHYSIYSALSALVYAADTPLSPKVKTSIEDFLSMLSFYRDKIMSGNDMAATVESLVENIDYWGWLIQEYQNNEKIATYKYRNITLFIDMLRRWERDPDTIDPNLYAFLNRITLITRDEADEEEQRGKVNLMTIHAAKGLEFDIVFLVGLEDGIIPHARSLEESDGNIEEERRLFYVAMTRAKNHLFLSSCLKRRYMNKTVECLPSPFIEEIPQELLTINTAHDPVDSNEAEDFFAKIHSKFT
jgi:DNA helicase-2/ATP-dependent DNA helicase PcrA